MENLKCEHPVIIFNRTSLSHMLRVGCYYINNIPQYIQPFQRECWSIFAPYTEFGKMAHILDKDDLQNYYVVAENGEIFPLFIEIPCGKCALCQERKANQWSNRCQMESEGFKHLPMFLTLTYEIEPKEGLVKKDVQAFLKRLRTHLQRNYKSNYRYACCGEYGKKTKRAHYHLLLWGLPDSWYFKPTTTMITNELFTKKCIDTMVTLWNNGIIKVKACIDSNASWYVTKYMRKSCEIPKGKNPTFWLSSRGTRGSVGALGMSGILYHKLDEKMRNTMQSSLSYLSRHDGKVKDFYNCKYYIDKVFPSVRQYLGQKYCNAMRQFTATCSIACRYLHEKVTNILNQIYVPDMFGHVLSLDSAKSFWQSTSIKDLKSMFVESVSIITDIQTKKQIDFWKLNELAVNRFYYLHNTLGLSAKTYDIDNELQRLNLANAKMTDIL